jgi:hypothetical protein
VRGIALGALQSIANSPFPFLRPPMFLAKFAAVRPPPAKPPAPSASW